MAVDFNNIRVGANGQVHVAPLDGTMPDTASESLDATWLDLGTVSEDGATFAVAKDITSIGAWQSLDPARRIVTGRTVTVSFVCREWNINAVEFALGMTVTDDGTDATATPIGAEEIDERALSVSWQDGDNSYRLIVPRGLVTGSTTTQLVRTAAADLPIEFSATPASGGDAFTLLSDDPALLAAS